MGDGNYKRLVSHVEKTLLQRGFELISGAIVSRVENRLKKNETREKWDRTEKALLLGKETGADAIFEVRSVYVDVVTRAFIKGDGDAEYVERPLAYARSQISQDSSMRMVQVPVWKASVELRIINMDGKVLWSGTKSISTTDIMPEDWHAKVAPIEGRAGAARIEKSGQNFDYFMYFHDAELQEKRVRMLIEDLIGQTPPPA
ncbi:MAG: hypothetical protein H6707_18315 [Deltaproteobacteria bacterium]|nr:hypothetical protein [Deltaproteobacteria bacterium]